MTRRALLSATSLAGLFLALTLGASGRLTAADSLQAPGQFIGFAVGEDRKLVRWDRIVEYMRLAARDSDRVRLRELGATNGGQPFILLEISAPETLRNLDRYKQLERKLYFQGGAPTPRELEDIFREGKAVVLVTCSVHGNEIGATQMVLELVHQLATDDSSAVRRILDNVILLLVPSANPDGQILVTDWYNQTVGTPYEASAVPFLYHPYAGHDLNRDMYMLTQKESQYLARLAWHDWFPAIWLDEHQMGSNGPRMFVMPAADPINPNVHPLIYRWNTILGQSQAAALEAAGKDGIIYSSTYTNFWQGALAWSGWWHNQIGLLTEVASARVASPVDQQRVALDGSLQHESGADRVMQGMPLLPPPGDITPRTEYPRPWLGGRWTLGDIVEYERIATLALLETAADRRETILRQVYEVNRQTAGGGGLDGVAAIVVPVESQQDPRQVGHLVDRLVLGGVEVRRAEMPFDLGGRRYAAGTFVIPMTQVFARYAKDLLERQTYPQVRRGPDAPFEEPYDVSAWSLGLQLGVDIEFSKAPFAPSVKSTRVAMRPRMPGRVVGNGTRFAFDYSGPDTAIAINRLLDAGAHVEFDGPSRAAATLVNRDLLDSLAREFGLIVTAGAQTTDVASARVPPLALRAPRVAVYSPWTGGNADEGWTRWVLEQYEFEPTTIHNADVSRGDLGHRFDAIVLPDQAPRELVEGHADPSVRPEYRGGIGDAGVENLGRFVAEGGTLIALGAASDFAIDRLGVPVRDLKRHLRRDQHSAPGTIVRLQVDTSHPLGYGMARDTHGFYMNGPFFAPLDDGTADRMTVVARYPATGVLASGWLVGEELMAGRAAVVSVDMAPGRIVLFGLRPQHRAQTHATFPLLFNALYLSAADARPVVTNQ
jgi:hypothetical protein